MERLQEKFDNAQKKNEIDNAIETQYILNSDEIKILSKIFKRKIISLCKKNSGHPVPAVLLEQANKRLDHKRARGVLEIGPNIKGCASYDKSHFCFVNEDARDQARYCTQTSNLPKNLQEEYVQLSNKKKCMKSLCNLGVQNCKKKYQEGISVHSAYDIPFEDWLKIFQNHDLQIVTVIMHLPPELLSKENLDGTYIFKKRSNGKCTFNFPGDTSIGYTHEYENWKKYLTNDIIPGNHFDILIERVLFEGTQCTMTLTRTTGSCNIVRDDYPIRKNCVRVPDVHDFIITNNYDPEKDIVTDADNAHKLLTYANSLEQTSFNTKTIMAYGRSLQTSIRIGNIVRNAPWNIKPHEFLTLVIRITMISMIQRLKYINNISVATKLINHSFRQVDVMEPNSPKEKNTKAYIVRYLFKKKKKHFYDKVWDFKKTIILLGYFLISFFFLMVCIMYTRNGHYIYHYDTNERNETYNKAFSFEVQNYFTMECNSAKYYYNVPNALIRNRITYVYGFRDYIKRCNLHGKFDPKYFNNNLSTFIQLFIYSAQKFYIDFLIITLVLTLSFFIIDYYAEITGRYNLNDLDEFDPKNPLTVNLLPEKSNEILYSYYPLRSYFKSPMLAYDLDKKYNDFLKPILKDFQRIYENYMPVNLPTKLLLNFKQYLFNTNFYFPSTVIRVSGPAGSGKTYQTLQQLDRNNTLFYVPSSDLQNEYKIKYKIDALTPHKITVGRKVKALVIDEWFTLPLGHIVFLASYYKPDKLYLLGDDAQIGLIDFDNIFGEKSVHYQHDKVIGSKIYYNTTHRCPQDIVKILNDRFEHQIVTTNNVRQSVNLNTFNGKAQTLVFTQNAKNKYPGSLTVHEAQGSTFVAVNLILTSDAKTLLEKSRSHFIVGITRHRNELNITYEKDVPEYTVFTHEYLNNLEILGTVLIQPNFNTEPVCAQYIQGINKPKHLLVETADAIDSILDLVTIGHTDYETCTRLNCDHPFSECEITGVDKIKKNLSNEPLIEKYRLLGNQYEHQTYSSDYNVALNTLIERYAKETPIFDEEYVKRKQNNFLKDFVNMYFEEKITTAYGEENYKDTNRYAFYNYIDLTDEGNDITAKAIFENYEASVKKDTERLYENFDDLGNDLQKINFFLKQQSKVKADHCDVNSLNQTGEAKFKAGQGVSAWSKTLNGVIGPFIRVMNMLLRVNFRDGVYIVNGLNDLHGLDMTINANMDHIRITETDISEFDCNQSKLSRCFITGLMIYLGLPQIIVDIYDQQRDQWALNLRGLATIYNHGKQHSGSPGTLDDNSLTSLLLLSQIMDASKSQILVKGDDLLIMDDKEVINPAKLFISDNTLKLPVKQNTDAPPQFIGFFLTPQGPVPDLLRLAMKVKSKPLSKGYVNIPESKYVQVFARESPKNSVLISDICIDGQLNLLWLIEVIKKENINFYIDIFVKNPELFRVAAGRLKKKIRIFMRETDLLNNVQCFQTSIRDRLNFLNTIERAQSSIDLTAANHNLTVNQVEFIYHYLHSLAYLPVRKIANWYVKVKRYNIPHDKEVEIQKSKNNFFFDVINLGSNKNDCLLRCLNYVYQNTKYAFKIRNCIQEIMYFYPEQPVPLEFALLILKHYKIPCTIGNYNSMQTNIYTNFLFSSEKSVNILLIDNHYVAVKRCGSKVFECTELYATENTTYEEITSTEITYERYAELDPERQARRDGKNLRSVGRFIICERCNTANWSESNNLCGNEICMGCTKLQQLQSNKCRTTILYKTESNASEKQYLCLDNRGSCSNVADWRCFDEHGNFKWGNDLLRFPIEKLQTKNFTPSDIQCIFYWWWRDVFRYCIFLSIPIHGRCARSRSNGHNKLRRLMDESDCCMEFTWGTTNEQINDDSTWCNCKRCLDGKRYCERGCLGCINTEGIHELCGRNCGQCGERVQDIRGYNNGCVHETLFDASRILVRTSFANITDWYITRKSIQLGLNKFEMESSGRYCTIRGNAKNDTPKSCFSTSNDVTWWGELRSSSNTGKSHKLNRGKNTSTNRKCERGRSTSDSEQYGRRTSKDCKFEYRRTASENDQSEYREETSECGSIEYGSNNSETISNCTSRRGSFNKESTSERDRGKISMGQNSRFWGNDNPISAGGRKERYPEEIDDYLVYQYNDFDFKNLKPNVMFVKNSLNLDARQPNHTIILHTISADHKMGAGFAKLVANRIVTQFPASKYFSTSILKNGVKVFNVITKNKYNQKPYISDFIKALDHTMSVISRQEYRVVLMPFIGTGLDGLNSTAVKKIITVLSAKYGIHIKVFVPIKKQKGRIRNVNNKRKFYNLINENNYHKIPTYKRNNNYNNYGFKKNVKIERKQINRTDNIMDNSLKN